MHLTKPQISSRDRHPKENICHKRGGQPTRKELKSNRKVKKKLNRTPINHKKLLKNHHRVKVHLYFQTLKVCFLADYHSIFTSNTMSYLISISNKS